MQSTQITINQLSNGLNPTRNTRGKFIANSKRIKYATQQLQLGLINIDEFLKRCSYSVASYEETLRNFSLQIPYEYDNDNEEQIREQEGNPPYAEDIRQYTM